MEVDRADQLSQDAIGGVGIDAGRGVQVFQTLGPDGGLEGLIEEVVAPLCRTQFAEPRQSRRGEAEANGEEGRRIA